MRSSFRVPVRCYCCIKI